VLLLLPLLVSIIDELENAELRIDATLVVTAFKMDDDVDDD